MKYVCDAPGRSTWFRLETQGEADQESALMDHAVARHFRREREAAVASYTPASSVFIEQNIGLKRHVQRSMPLFLTLRDQDGQALATAMLPPGGADDPSFRIIVVGPSNVDPYIMHRPAIEALGAHFGLRLDRDRCFPYRR